MKFIIEQGRFGLLPAIVAVGVLTLLAGGYWLWLGGALILVVNLAIDEIGEDYLDGIEAPLRPMLNGLLFAAPVFLALMTFGMLLYAASPGTPMAALGALLGMEAHRPLQWLEAAGVIFSHGLLAGFSGVSFAHELIHRPVRKEQLLGQAMLTLCLHPSIAIEHVHGHHRHVGTTTDPTLPVRGTGFWRYMPTTVAGEMRCAAIYEATRLHAARFPTALLQNRFVQGMAMLLFLLCGSMLLAGLAGVGAVIASGALGLVVVELGNYVTHYGLIRVPGQPVLPRHSWNAPRYFSSSTLLNSPRHSHHHKSAATPYWSLEQIGQAAIYPHGISVMSVLALVPPLWFKVVNASLVDWDQRMASSEELMLIQGAARLQGTHRTSRGAAA